MSLPSQLVGLAEVKSALAVDPDGRQVAAEPAEAEGAAELVVVSHALAEAGRAARLGPLAMIHVKGPQSSSVAALRADLLVRVTVDPATTTAQVDRALREWAEGPAAAKPTAGKPPAPARAVTPPRGSPAPARAVTPPKGSPAPGVSRPQPAADPWAALRRSLGRGQLNGAIAYGQQLLGAADPGRSGSEPIEADACDRAVRALLEGIGSTLAGDGVGGARILAPLTGEDQPNLSFRWLALVWSARAAMKSGAAPTARAQIQEALTAARQLDIEARALSQWVAAEVLAQDGDPTRALAWLSEARSRFEKVGDRWGMGQTWLSEARVLTGSKREQEASEAARQAADLMPDAEEPQVVLARLCVIRDDLVGAERLLRPLKTQAAERVRGLVTAVKGGVLQAPDAGEFLREQDAPPSDRALRALERIANAAPRFLPAREALAWMLLRTGRYDAATTVFRGLLSQPLPPGDRASVMLGLGCLGNALGEGNASSTPLRAVVAAATEPAGAAADPLPPLPSLSTSAMLSRAPPGAGDAVFSGQLNSFALPDLLEFLRSGKRTGLLVCSSASGMGALRFRDGWITGAASPSTPGIGEILVLARKIKPEAVGRIIAALGGDPSDLVVADQLIRDGVVDTPVVRAGFERQVRFALRELMLWTDGEFTFNREAEAAPESAALAISLDPQGLLLNFFKEMDEASRGAVSP